MWGGSSRTGDIAAAASRSRPALEERVGWDPGDSGGKNTQSHIRLCSDQKRFTKEESWGITFVLLGLKSGFIDLTGGVIHRGDLQCWVFMHCKYNTWIEQRRDGVKKKGNHIQKQNKILNNFFTSWFWILNGISNDGIVLIPLTTLLLSQWL